MRLILSTLCVLAALAAGTTPVRAQPAAGTRTTPDGKQVLISKDVGSERWAISMNLDDGTVTGNVFRPGAEPSFVWCERTGDDGALMLVRRFLTQNYQIQFKLRL